VFYAKVGFVNIVCKKKIIGQIEEYDEPGIPTSGDFARFWSWGKLQNFLLLIIRP
jgi:hypothetical protein